MLLLQLYVRAGFLTIKEVYIATTKTVTVTCVTTLWQAATMVSTLWSPVDLYSVQCCMNSMHIEHS